MPCHGVEQVSSYPRTTPTRRLLNILYQLFVLGPKASVRINRGRVVPVWGNLTSRIAPMLRKCRHGCIYGTGWSTSGL